MSTKLIRDDLNIRISINQLLIVFDIWIHIDIIRLYTWSSYSTIFNYICYCCQCKIIFFKAQGNRELFKNSMSQTSILKKITNILKEVHIAILRGIWITARFQQILTIKRLNVFKSNHIFSNMISGFNFSIDIS